MTISELLDQLHDTIDKLALSPTDYGIYDDEDLIAFALRYLMANLEHAMKKE